MPQSGFEDGFTVATSGSLDTWVKEIFAKVPGAVEGYIYDQLKLVIKDFFQRTKSWRSTLGPFTISANDGELPINPVDALTNAIQILSVIRDGSVLLQTPQKNVPLFLRSQTSQNNPSRYYLDPYDTINLVPTNTLDVEDIYVTVALTPRLQADNRIHQWVIDQHYEAIKSGVLERLYQEPGKVYTNTNASELWGKRYRAELTRSRSVAAQNYGEMPQPWSFNRGGM